MAQVAENRGMDLTGYVDGVSLMSSGDIGRDVWLEFEDGRVIGPLLVIDCSQRKHYKMNVNRGRVADVSRELWDDLNLPEDLVPATVLFRRPWLGRKFYPQ